MVLSLSRPSLDDVNSIRKNSIYVGFLDPFNNKELVTAMAEGGIATFAMEMIPRITRAQKMDALSSQANLAGYVAVILAAAELSRIFPMMMTPAGTLAPARVFVIGAGVAGLQAIATAKRLGARVEAYDTRPEVEEQVQSLGARFVTIDVGKSMMTPDGYAKQLTRSQIEKQRQGMADTCAQADVVITTAQVFGRTAPVIITAEMVAQMKPGTVIVDLAVESGGNVEGSKADETADIKGVRIIGLTNFPGQVADHASRMYSSNLYNLVEEYWDTDTKQFVLDTEDEIIQGGLITHDGAVCHPQLVVAYRPEDKSAEKGD
jgi:NAD(P) transhydrogenase subunit alpha